jgi:hypothetical protein
MRLNPVFRHHGHIKIKSVYKHALLPNIGPEGKINNPEHQSEILEFYQ